MQVLEAGDAASSPEKGLSSSESTYQISETTPYKILEKTTLYTVQIVL